MKKIEAYVKPFKLDALKDALLEAGVSDLRFVPIHESAGSNFQEFYRGTEYAVDSDARTMVMMMINDDQVENITRLIQDIARTDNEADGKILVIPVEQMIEIGREPVKKTE